jgi:hypothetical protein
MTCKLLILIFYLSNIHNGAVKMELFYIMLVLLLVSRLFGELTERFGQPSLVGELIAGITLGILVHQYSGAFPVLAGIPDDEVFIAITDLAIFFLMLLAGLELYPAELAKASKKAFTIAVGGMLFPLAIGFGLGWLFIPESNFKLAQTLFIATTLAVTAIPVAAKVLMEFGQCGIDHRRYCLARRFVCTSRTDPADYRLFVLGSSHPTFRTSLSHLRNKFFHTVAPVVLARANDRN